MGSSESVMMTISVTNIGEPAYITQIRLIVFSPVGIARLPKSCRIEEEYDFNINLPPALLCDLDNPLKGNSTKVIMKIFYAIIQCKFIKKYFLVEFDFRNRHESSCKWKSYFYS